MSKKQNERHEFAQDTIKELIEKSKEVIEEMSDYARDAEHPKIYEVLNQVIKNTADMARTLVRNEYDDEKIESDRRIGVSNGGDGNGNKQPIMLLDTTELQRKMIESRAKADSTEVEVDIDE